MGLSEGLLLREKFAACRRGLKGQRDVDGKSILDEQSTDVQPAHVAAALALLCGYYTKKNSALNPSVAAEAFDHPTSRPGKVAEWMAKLQRLEAALEARDARVTSRPELASLRVLALQCLDEQRARPSADWVSRWAHFFAATAEASLFRIP